MAMRKQQHDSEEAARRAALDQVIDGLRDKQRATLDRILELEGCGIKPERISACPDAAEQTMPSVANEARALLASSARLALH
jgi:hypothetical protein